VSKSGSRTTAAGGSTRRVAGAATVAAGLVSIFSAVTPDVAWRHQLLTDVEPGPAIALGHVLAAAAGAGLVGLGWGMLRGKRRAVDAAVVVLCVSALLHALKGLDYEESAVALVLAAVLWRGRGAFRRGGAPRPGLVAATFAVAALAGVFALDLTWLLVTGKAETLRTGLSATWHGLSAGVWWLDSGEPIAIALDVLLVAGLLAGAEFLLALLRPAPAAHGHSDGELAHATAILSRYGRDSIAPFALREDKAYHFAAGGFLAYRVLRETAVVSGDPVGPPGSAPAILLDFAEHAARHGWDVVVTGASRAHVRGYERIGMRALKIGEEAFVEPARFSLEGRAIRKVRQSVARVARRGWRVEIVDHVRHGSALQGELEAAERAWRAERRRLHGFAMTLGGRPCPHGVYALARDPDGTLRAFIRFVPHGAGLSLDMMRRYGELPNGINEAMIVAAIEHARERGLAEVSLNFAGFAHVMAATPDEPLRYRLLRLVLTRMHGRFQLERLARFNRQFLPEWRPRYLVYGSRTQLPLAALRVLQAEAYIRPPRPRLSRRLRLGLPRPAALSPPEASR
jgi:lysyl-tRNA synthetase class 2